MKFVLTIAFLLLTLNIGLAQNQHYIQQNNRKGKLYFYWGWNRNWYSKSDIKFKGVNYNFRLKGVVAKDRQTKFGINAYFNPANATIPQYNFRIGYFVHNNYNISFGIDHMKYVVQSKQVVKISGNIDNTGSIYNGIYTNDNIIIEEGFLEFEHTDGLNYINMSFRRLHEIFHFSKIKIYFTEGIGAGILLPKTNATILNQYRYDEFHLSGFGIDGVFGINFEFNKHIFIQSILKGGYINMSDIRTSTSKSDSASQDFFFIQFNLVFGATINLW